MFDVSFAELMVVAVVALLVIGPEKLPKVARTVGAFAGRMQRYAAQVKEEINREVRFEELQNLQQEIKQSVEQHSRHVKADFDETLKKTGLENLSPQAKKSVVAPLKKTIKKTAVNSKNQAILATSSLPNKDETVNGLTHTNSQKSAQSTQLEFSSVPSQSQQSLKKSLASKQKKTRL